MSVDEALDSYLTEPGPGRLLRLHREILDLDEFRREMPYLREATILARQGRHHESVTVLRRHERAAVFSPAFHRLLAEGLAELGEIAESARHQHRHDASLQAIFASGDGSAERPWLVLHAADEHEAMRARGLDVMDQAVFPAGDHLLDALDSSDGSRHWFVVL